MAVAEKPTLTVVEPSEQAEADHTSALIDLLRERLDAGDSYRDAARATVQCAITRGWLRDIAFSITMDGFMQVARTLPSRDRQAFTGAVRDPDVDLNEDDVKPRQLQAGGKVKAATSNIDFMATPYTYGQKQVAVGDMDRATCLAVAEAYRTQGMGDLRHAAFLTELASRLTGEKTVREVMDATDVRDLGRQVWGTDSLAQIWMRVSKLDGVYRGK